MYESLSCQWMCKSVNSPWLHYSWRGGGGSSFHISIDRWMRFPRVRASSSTWSPAPTSSSARPTWTPSAIFGDCCSMATNKFRVLWSNPAQPHRHHRGDSQLSHTATHTLGRDRDRAETGGGGVVGEGKGQRIVERHVKQKPAIYVCNLPLDESS